MCLVWEETNKRKTKGSVDFCEPQSGEGDWETKALFTVP